MGNISVEQAARWCGGTFDPKYAGVTFLGANNDTRNLKPGQLFVALQGARDGHEFIPAALERGAAAVLCSRCEGDYPAIVVEDPRRALGDIARQERKRIGMQMVGVTGSVGKSTTKEMIACVLEGSFRVEKTPANHNNDIGMPMAILAMPEDTQVAVLEMGMNHFGEIAYLTSIACPDLAVIVNVGTMHIENLGSKEGILQAKMEIAEGMQEGSTLLLNGDDILLWSQRDIKRVKPRFFGVDNGDVFCHGSQITMEEGALRLQVSCSGCSFPIELALEGRHYASDALAAVGVGMTLGVAPVKIQERLAQFRNMAGRQEIFTYGEYTIIKDCYNAGPESMQAALQVLGNRPGRHVAVLGDMLELGVCSAAEHYRIGRIAAQHVQLLLAYGPNAGRVINGAVTDGLPESNTRLFDDRQKMAEFLKRSAKPGDTILFKGSRGMRMELVLEAFMKDET